jgi:hypothetical protein
MKLREMYAVAAMAGHSGAYRIALENLEPLHDPNFWFSFGEPQVYRGEMGGELQVQDLAEYVCGYHDDVSGEQAFRKAAEMGIHQHDADGWAALPLRDRLCYQLFCVSVRACFKLLIVEVPVEAEPVVEAVPDAETVPGHESEQGLAPLVPVSEAAAADPSVFPAPDAPSGAAPAPPDGTASASA